MTIVIWNTVARETTVIGTGRTQPEDILLENPFLRGCCLRGDSSKSRGEERDDRFTMEGILREKERESSRVTCIFSRLVFPRGNWLRASRYHRRDIRVSSS